MTATATSPVATVTVTISSAPLVSLDFVQGEREPEFNIGDTRSMLVVGNFADQQNVPLPASYVTFQTVDPTIATVDSTGELTGIGEGFTALVVSSQGIQAATVVDVDDPTDLNPPDYSGLVVSPQAISLPDDGGTQQIGVELDQGQPQDITAGSTGTLYFASNPSIVTVSADGLVTALADGSTTVTVIAAGQEMVIPVQVVAPQLGPETVGTGGGVVRGTDGAQLQIAAGALSYAITVQISPVALASLPEGSPNGFQIFGAEQLNLGGESLSRPGQIAVPVPPGTAVGSKVYVYLATTLPDETGTEVPVWQEVDVGIVGADGFARTGTAAYQGILSQGTYAFALANDPTEVAQVRVTIDPSSIVPGVVGATYAWSIRSRIQVP